MYGIETGQHVLLVWGAASQPEIFKKSVEQVQSMTGKSGKVAIENIERLSLGPYPASSFDVILSGVIFPQSIRHTVEVLAELLKLVKPSGKVILHEAVVSNSNGTSLNTIEKLQSTLKICGLTNIQDAKSIVISESDNEKLKDLLNAKENVNVVEIQCQKPNFEVGSSARLSFAKKTVEQKSANVAAVWKLDDTVDDDIETVDENTLLEEEDKIKPDQSSLRVCGTTGKRKACKNCSCGLAEELEQENAQQTVTKTSACGNCYLGDAFRCASCPYLGMPAFKPGEKIQLSDRQLKADV